MKSDSSVDLSFTYTRDDYVAARKAYEAHFSRQPRYIISSLGSFLLLLIAIVSLGFVAILGPLRREDWILVAIIGGAVLLTVIRIIRTHFIVSTKPFDSNPKWHHPMHWLVSEAGVQARSDTIDSQVQWNHYFKIVETGKLYLFLDGENYGSSWNFVPKRVFSSMEQELRFRALLAHHARFVPIKDGMG